MADVGELTVRVMADRDSDAEELADLTQGLCGELLDAEVDSVTPLTDELAPEGAKGLGTLADWLLVRFATVEGVRAVVAAVRGWVSRNGRSVEVNIDGDVLKLTSLTSQQQEKIIDAWLARHAPSS